MNFWSAFNLSRCKVALLIISVIVISATVALEIVKPENEFLRGATLMLITFWMGRYSKNEEQTSSKNKKLWPSSEISGT